MNLDTSKKTPLDDLRFEHRMALAKGDLDRAGVLLDAICKLRVEECANEINSMIDADHNELIKIINKALGRPEDEGIHTEKLRFEELIPERLHDPGLYP